MSGRLEGGGQATAADGRYQLYGGGSHPGDLVLALSNRRPISLLTQFHRSPALSPSDDLITIYGRGGTVIAWIDDGVVFDMCGRWVAFLDEVSVFSFTGKLLGFYEGGWFRDQRGEAVAFTPGCNDEGPVLPICEEPPLPPALDCPPMPPAPSVLPVSPMPGVDWSLQHWSEFLSGSASLASMY